MRGVLEHEVHQRDDEARHHEDHRDAAVIRRELAQDSPGGGEIGLRAQPVAAAVLCRMTDRNASSSD